jgi:hypothetical protein
MFHISAGLPGGTFRAFEDIAVSMSNVSHTSWNYFFFLDNWWCNEILGLCMHKRVKEIGVCIYVISAQDHVGSVVGFFQKHHFEPWPHYWLFRLTFNIIFLSSSMWILRQCVETGHEYSKSLSAIHCHFTSNLNV